MNYAARNYAVGDMPPFAAWLQETFENKTQAEVARKLGISRQYAWDLGMGRRRLTLALALRIRKVMPQFPLRRLLRAELDYDIDHWVEG